MKKDTTKKLWLFAAACFILLGIVDKNIAFIALGASYVSIGFSMNSKKPADTDAARKTSKKGTFHK